MLQNKVILTSLLAVLLTAGALFVLAPEANEANISSLTKDTTLTCVSRSTMIARGQDWVDKHVPYSQSGTHDGYRTDCSGFVSMCWELPKPGHTTSTLPGVSTSISKAELQNGDALLCPGTHVVLFAGWSDSSRTHYTGMEQSNPTTGTIKRVIPYPFWDNVSCYHPVKYNGVC